MSKVATYKGSQGEFDLGASDKAQRATARLAELRWRIVDRLTPQEAAWRLDVKPQYLSDVRAGRDRKAWKDEWNQILFEAATDDEAKEWVSILVDIRRPPMSAEERLARLEERLRSKLGTIGEEILAEVGR